jgi:two-component sensor histidine kinase
MSLSASPLVLVVEDDVGISELVLERIGGMGFACESVGTGAAAVARFSERRPDLVVLDYSLPDMRADDVIRSPGMPPFMIATGRGDEETAVRLMRAGARDYVIKDSSFLEELPIVVARVLRELDTERRLAEAHKGIEASLREKEAMLREIHHRVKNNLQIIQSLISLQEPSDPDESLRAILSDMRSRISAMALIHEMLYQSADLAKIDFLHYLDALTRGLVSAFAPSGREMDIAASGESFELPIDRALPLGLIANELVTNALKHAFPPSWDEGRARVLARAGMSAGGIPFIEISDNGIGLDGRCRSNLGPARAQEGLGLQLVRILVQQLGAELEQGPGPSDRGTLWRITLRAPEA